jgi:WD40 repeat protein
VTCIDISDDGHYLLAGYKKGTLVLWDASKYKMAHIMRDVAKNENSEFTQVKILAESESGVLNIVTSEESGRVRLVHVSKGNFFSSFSHKANSLYESDLQGVATISVQKPSSDPYYYSNFCNNACIVAFGATNLISLVEMA